MKNTLLYVLIAVAVILLAWKLAYPKAPSPDMIAKVGDAANKMASGADTMADAAKKMAADAANKVASGAANVASGVAGVASGMAGAVADKMGMSDSYTIAAGSVVNWVGKKVAGQHTGTISISEGTITVKNGVVQGGKVVLDMKTIKSLDAGGGAKLDGHLAGPDFFDATIYPIGEFAINNVSNGIIKGDLILKGVTKEISFPGTVVVNGDIVTVKAKTNIERALWNVKGMEAVIDKYFEIEFNVSFAKKK